MKFLHTADWQLGLKLNWVVPEKAAQLRLLRYQTIERIAEVARAHAVDFVVVAGDVLDDNALGLDALQQTAEALEAFGGLPVYLLPGNHDAATEDAGLRRVKLPPNCHFLDTRTPITVPGGRLFPCPLMRRHETQDPSAWLPENEANAGIRVAVAHGGAIEFGQNENEETKNQLDTAAILKKGFDYVALGDWHGLLRLNDRVWYSGAHEATRFKEKDPGHVLVVTIDSPGAIPEVVPVQVAQTKWITWDIHFTEGTQVQALRARIEALPRLSTVLLEIRATGALSLAARTDLDELLNEVAARTAHLRAPLDDLHTEPTPEDLAQIAGDGFLAGALAELRDGGEPVDDAAIRLMYRLQQQIKTRAAS